MPYKCTFPGCTASFRTKRMLEPHLRSHTHEWAWRGAVSCRPSPHKCLVPGCGKVFTYRSGLLAHIRSIHDRKLPIRCPEKNCRLSFMTNSQLQEHYERAHRNSQQSAQSQLFDSARLPPSIQSMQLPVLSIDNMNRSMMSPVQQQQLILPSIATRNNTLSDIPIMSEMNSGQSK